MFDSQPVALEKHGNENTANPAKKVSVAVFAQFVCGFFTSYVLWQQIEAKTVRDQDRNRRCCRGGDEGNVDGRACNDPGVRGGNR